MDINSFESAAQGYEKLFPGSPFLKTWIPASSTISIQSDVKENFSITRSDKEIYSFAFGPNPIISSDWLKFSVESRAKDAVPTDVSIVDEWDCYWTPTWPAEQLPVRGSTDSMIRDFLLAHAPDSSVLPGNEEILHWAEVIEDGELLAVAALCRWQSGELVLSSVATHSQQRGIGLGRQVVESALKAASVLGFTRLSLGVLHGNESAQGLYQSMGFKLMHNFIHCERR